MKPLLILFSGKAGTGKTTLARWLSKETHTAYFDYDTLNQPFLESIEKIYGLGDGDRYAFYRFWRKTTYDTLWAPVWENLALGNDVVLSAPLSKEIRDPEFPRKLQAHGPVPFAMLLCHMAPPQELHYKMVEARGSRRDEDFIGNRKSFDLVYGNEVPLWDASSVIILDSGDFDRNAQTVIQRVCSLREEIR